MIAMNHILLLLLLLLFRHLNKILSLFSDEIFPDKVSETCYVIIKKKCSFDIPQRKNHSNKIVYYASRQINASHFTIEWFQMFHDDATQPLLSLYKSEMFCLFLFYSFSLLLLHYENGLLTFPFALLVVIIGMFIC